VSSGRPPERNLVALFDAFALRVEAGDFLHTCPAGTVCLDLEAGMDGLRAAVAASFEAYRRAIERHFPQATPARTRAFAGLVLTAIEGAYVRSRAERSGAAFREAGRWLVKLV
jgi:TetR/AcrR family transcriptional regulator, lmrAB and yxaGH operons repressor